MRPTPTQVAGTTVPGPIEAVKTSAGRSQLMKFAGGAFVFALVFAAVQPSGNKLGAWIASFIPSPGGARAPGGTTASPLQGFFGGN